MPAKTAPMAAPTSSRVSTRSTRSAARKELGTDRKGTKRPGTAPELLQRHDLNDDDADSADLVSERGNVAQRARQSRQTRATRKTSHSAQVAEGLPDPEPQSSDEEAAEEAAEEARSAADEAPSETDERMNAETSDGSHPSIEHVDRGVADANPAVLKAQEHQRSSGINEKKVMQMIETLPELWDSSRKLVRLLAPVNTDSSSLQRLTADLQDPRSLSSQNRNKLSAVYGDIFERVYYRMPRLRPAEAQSQLLCSQGIQGLAEVPDESLRADEIFYMANLSILINEDVPPDGTIPSYGCLYFLSTEFPDPYLSGVSPGIGTTGLLKKTIELGIMFRVEFLKSTVAEEGHQEKFNFQRALTQIFYEPDNDEKVFRSFGSLRQFQSSNLNRTEQKWIRAVVDKLQSIAKAATENGEDLLQALMASFPSEDFAVTFIQWVSARGRELEKAVRSRIEEVEDLQRSLYEFATRPLQNDASSPLKQLRPLYDFKVSQSAKPDSGQNGKKIRSDQNTLRNREFLKQKRATADRQTAETEGERSQKEMSRERGDQLDTVIVRIPSRGKAQRAKSSTSSSKKGTHKSLLDTQPDAVREQWESLERAGVDRDNGYVPENADVDDQEVDEDGEAEEEQGDEMGKDGESEDEDADGFQEDTRPNFQRARRELRKSGPPADASQQNSRPTKRQKTKTRSGTTVAKEATPELTAEERAEAARKAEEEERAELAYRTSEYVSDRQRQYREMMEKAKATAEKSKQAVGRQAKKDRPRKFWDDVEDDALLAGLAAHGGSSQRFLHIKNFYREQTPDPLAERSNVDLKDRTRVITMQYIKNGIPLQKGMSKTDLKKTDQETLENLGIDLTEIP